MKLKNELIKIKSVDAYLFNINYLLDKLFLYKYDLAKNQREELADLNQKFKTIQHLLFQNKIKNKNNNWEQQVKDEYIFLKEDKIITKLSDILLKISLLYSNFVFEKLKHYWLSENKEITKNQIKELIKIEYEFVTSEIKNAEINFLKTQNKQLKRNKNRWKNKKINKLLIKRAKYYLVLSGVELKPDWSELSVNRLIKNDVQSILDKNDDEE